MRIGNAELPGVRANFAPGAGEAGPAARLLRVCYLQAFGGSCTLDCEPGAVPPLGAAYGLDVVVDDSLTDHSDVYFEGTTTIWFTSAGLTFRS